MRLKTQISELDRRLHRHYGDRYIKVKNLIDHAKDRYTKARSEAEISGTVPLEKNREAVHRHIARAGSRAASREQSLKQQLKRLWHTITSH